MSKSNNNLKVSKKCKRGKSIDKTPQRHLQLTLKEENEN